MISFTQGDTAILNLTANTGTCPPTPMNITGATFTTYILGAAGVVEEFDNSQHAIVDAAEGTFTLTLSAEDTAECGIGFEKDIITEVVQGGSTVYLHGIGILNVLSATPTR